MGMFDYISISTSHLPLSDTEKHIIGNRFYAQTKSLGLVLDYYVITKGVNLVLYTTDNKYKKQDFTGKIEFYDCIDGTWFEFIATFTAGELVSVECINS